MKNLNELIKTSTTERWNKEKLRRIVNTPVQVTMEITDVDEGFIMTGVNFPQIVGKLPELDYSIVLRISNEYYNKVAIELNIGENKSFVGRIYEIDTIKKNIFIVQA